MARQSPNDSVSVFCTLYSIFWTLYSVFSTLNSVFCTRNFVFCTLNFVFCTLNFMFCTLIPVLRVWQSDGWAVKLPQGRLRWLWLICYNNNIHSSLNSEHGTVGNLGGHLFLCKFIYWQMWIYSPKASLISHTVLYDQSFKISERTEKSVMTAWPPYFPTMLYKLARALKVVKPAKNWVMESRKNINHVEFLTAGKEGGGYQRD